MSHHDDIPMDELDKPSQAELDEARKRMGFLTSDQKTICRLEQEKAALVKMVRKAYAELYEVRVKEIRATLDKMRMKENMVMERKILFEYPAYIREIMSDNISFAISINGRYKHLDIPRNELCFQPVVGLDLIAQGVIENGEKRIRFVLPSKCELTDEEKQIIEECL